MVFISWFTLVPPLHGPRAGFCAAAGGAGGAFHFFVEGTLKLPLLEKNHSSGSNKLVVLMQHVSLYITINNCAHTQTYTYMRVHITTIMDRCVMISNNPNKEY